MVSYIEHAHTTPSRSQPIENIELDAYFLGLKDDRDALSPAEQTVGAVYIAAGIVGVLGMSIAFLGSFLGVLWLLTKAGV